MKRRLVALLVGVVALTSATLVEPVERASADIGFCGGSYGVRVWTAFNYTGTSYTFCADAAGNIARSDLGNYGMDNVISSVQTRNQPAGPLWHMSLYTGYSFSGSRCRLDGNESVPNMSDCSGSGNFNNVVSSLRKTAT